ncbi:unnamed protein product [Orchesella dallaii]|uniref:Uncharacterized protein n=1 Tax=Orchesella dallaii TaxID=48710 RepID=A0ABP1S514_9HEXA
MMWKLLISIAILAAAGASVSGLTLGVYESYLCAARRNFSSGFLSCNEDCQLSHGAIGGACLDPTRINRYNCICDAPSGQLPRREQQCLHDNVAFRDFCVLDCQCNHGAVTGHCNFGLKSCFCDGFNPTNRGCPAYSFQHFLLLVEHIFKVKAGLSSPIFLTGHK